MNDSAQQPGGVPDAAQAAIEYRQAIMKVRGWCAMLAFFGALAIWQGFQLMEAGVDIAVVGIVIGGVLLLAALAAALKPSPGTMLLEAGAFAAIAAWDLLLAVLSGGEAAESVIWGVIEAGIALYLFAKLPGFIRIAAQKPDATGSPGTPTRPCRSAGRSMTPRAPMRALQPDTTAASPAGQPPRRRRR